MEFDPKKLMEHAIKAQDYAHAPYSEFQVGAALLCEDGSIYTGCNIENASYPAGNCAERTAVFKAVSEGKKKFKGLAICGGKAGDKRGACAPCGICRQVLSEFVNGDFPVILEMDSGEYQVVTLDELLPLRFSSDNLQ